MEKTTTLLSAPVHVIDDRRRVVILEDATAGARFATRFIIQQAAECSQNKGSYSIALSGGSTPKEIYHLLSTETFRHEIEWSRVRLFWSDERCVPPTDIDSNYRMAMDAGFQDLPIDATQIFRMHGELDPVKAAADYSEVLKEHLPRSRFDLVMLGMGPDGHTASLFPGTEGLKSTEPYAIANPVPQKETTRLTLTFPCINSAAQTLFTVFGASKADKVREVLSSKGHENPAFHIGTKEAPALWLLDEESAHGLLS